MAVTVCLCRKLLLMIVLCATASAPVTDAAAHVHVPSIISRRQDSQELQPASLRPQQQPRSGGLAEFTVVVAPEASTSERFAAAELAHIIGNLTDPKFSPSRSSAPLRTTTDLACAAPNRLVVGWAAATQNLGLAKAELNASYFGNDGFVLWKGDVHVWPSCAGTCVALTGAEASVRSGKRGALYAVYELLERLGTRFLSHDETIWPTLDSPDGPKVGVRELPMFEKVVQPQPLKLVQPLQLLQPS